MSERQFIPEVINGHRWGDSTLTKMPPTHLSEEQLLPYVYALAHSAGCPIPNEVIARKGLFNTGRDYAQVNYYYRKLLALAHTHNQSLSWQLRKTELRQEPVGHYEPGFVPKSHLTMIAPKCRMYGFGSSRIVRDITLSAAEHTKPSALWDSARDFITDDVARSQDPAELLARLAGTAIDDKELQQPES